MKLKIYDKPLFIEELVFEIRPDLVDAYLEADYRFFASKMEGIKGYLGFEIWVSGTKPGYVRNIIFREDKGFFEAVDENWIKQADQQLKAKLGEENVRLVEASHTVNQMYLAREFR